MDKLIRSKNPDLIIYDAAHPAFGVYGRLVDDPYFKRVAEYINKHTDIPDGCCYVASDAGAEALPGFAEAEKRLYGQMRAQMGYCNGTCHELEALEYHMGSEHVVAATDLILLLVDARTLFEDRFVHSSAVEAFYLCAGQTVELFSTALHYAPSAVSAAGFRAGIMLPRGTNAELSEKPADPRLTAVNKWLVSFEDGICGHKIPVNF